VSDSFVCELFKYLRKRFAGKSPDSLIWTSEIQTNFIIYIISDKKPQGASPAKDLAREDGLNGIE
jgi:hypothetical protein